MAEAYQQCAVVLLFSVGLLSPERDAKVHVHGVLCRDTTQLFIARRAPRTSLTTHSCVLCGGSENMKVVNRKFCVFLKS